MGRGDDFWQEIGAEEYQQIAAKTKRNKYGNKPVTIDGRWFQSTGEGRRFKELVLMQDAGEINHLVLQPRFPFVVNGVKVGEYRADFAYEEAGALVVEDYKGFKTPVYKLKRALMLALYGIEIREVTG